ncbi:MAG: phosphoglucomutase/phosphomannomutase family protein, partial [Candidatus Saccharimonadales bacterium]
MNAQSMARVARAYTRFLFSSGPGRPFITIGYDHRESSRRFAEIVSSVCRKEGAQVELFDHPVPTPLVSFAVWHQKRSGGIVITASHNPPEYNGFKIKEPWGGSARESTTSLVEALVKDQLDESVPSAELTVSVDSPAPEVEQAYFRRLGELVDLQTIREAAIPAVVDSMHGTGGNLLARLLGDRFPSIKIIRSQPDASFGGTAPEPISKNFGPLRDAVRIGAADLGMALDGDADRLGALDENGTNMTLQEVAPLLLHHLV